MFLENNPLVITLLLLFSQLFCPTLKWTINFNFIIYYSIDIKFIAAVTFTKPCNTQSLQ